MAGWQIPGEPFCDFVVGLLWKRGRRREKAARPRTRVETNLAKLKPTRNGKEGGEIHLLPEAGRSGRRLSLRQDPGWTWDQHLKRVWREDPGSFLMSARATRRSAAAAAERGV